VTADFLQRSAVREMKKSLTDILLAGIGFSQIAGY